ncbi:MAG: hypothetical protein ACT4P3_11120, partial [Betaproteobacteria bacterium]
MRTPLFLLSLIPLSVLAQDAGLVNHLAGDVAYVSAGKSAAATPYMKLREGDRFRVAPGAQVRVVYFAGGRQESFTGPAEFVAGSDSSRVLSGAQPQVSSLPSGVPQKIAKTPELLAIAKMGRAGGFAVRGGMKPRTPRQEEELRAARANYKQMREAAVADDITPELYLCAVLDEQRRYADMKDVVSEMQRRQPANPDVALMAEYVQQKLEGK